MNEDYILEPLPDVTDSGVDRDTDRYVHHVVYKSNQLVNMGLVNGSIEGRHREGMKKRNKHSKKYIFSIYKT